MFDWITSAVQQTGYLGIGLLMLGENVFPPIPSELIMPFAGFIAARGKLQVWAALAVGSLGSLAGALLWYYVGKWVGCRRLERWAGQHGRWLTLSPDDVGSANDWFHRHGGAAVFFGRLIPGVRTLISVPAGVSEMSLPWFLAYTAAGTVLWTGLLLGAGYLLESQYTQVEAYMNPVSNAVVGLLVLYYLYRVVTFRSRQAD